MQGIFIRTIIAILGLFLASKIVPGVTIHGAGTFILAGLLVGLVNAIVRPIAIILTLPLTILTLGLFLFVLNAGMFGARGGVSRQFLGRRFLVRVVRCHYCQHHEHCFVLVYRAEGQVRSIRHPPAVVREDTFTGNLA